VWISQKIYSGLITGFLLVAESDEKQIQLDVLGNTLSNDSCHYTLQIKNNINSKIDMLNITLIAVDNFRSIIGKAEFDAKNLAELQPYVRAITMRRSNQAAHQNLECKDTKFLEVSVKECIINGINKIKFCDEAITTQNKNKYIKVIRSNILPPIIESETQEEITIKDLGVKVKKINKNLANIYNLKVQTQGLIVTHVNTPDLLLSIGDIILEASFYPTIGPSSLQSKITEEKISKNTSIILTIIRNSEEVWIAVPFI